MNKPVKQIFFITLLSLPQNAFTENNAPESTPTKSITQPLKTTPNKGIDIQKVMDYPIPHVIARYRKDYKASEEDAKIHERELKRYLILTGEYPDDGLEMLSPEVDNLWHTFLLFTKDYQKFCNEMFGRFIHHVPKVDKEQTEQV